MVTADRSFEPAVPAAEDALLEVRDLTVRFQRGSASKEVISRLSYSIAPGKTLGVVGESGCGKSMTALALLGLVPYRGQVSGSIRFQGRELLSQSKSEWRRLRGHRIAMIFQEPMTALNPVMTGRCADRGGAHPALQAVEARGLPTCGRPLGLRRHPVAATAGERFPASHVGRHAAARHDRNGAGLPSLASGGGRADHRSGRHHSSPDPRPDDRAAGRDRNVDPIHQPQSGGGSELSDTILVMYAGRAVEYAPASVLFANPLHPYTRGLIATIPDPQRRVDRLPVIKGSVPSNLAMLGGGCRSRVAVSARD